jgi:hypothetical protein
MDEIIRSGRIADVILVAIAAELLVVGVWMWRRGQGLALLSFVASCLSGGALVLALRAVLREQGWLFVAICLFAALLAHMADLVLRLRSTRRPQSAPSED